MYKIFLIIFILQYVKADDRSNEKYIDLLPEEEKQEFLNRIARRILEEVNSPNIPNESHAEVNEEQLDAQNAYVKQIMKEESKMLQNEKRDGSLTNDQETSNRGEKNSVIDPHIDLTLRTRSKEERNDSELIEHPDLRSELKVLPFINNQENVKSNDSNAIKSEPNVNTQAIRDKNITTELGEGMKDEFITTNYTHSTKNDDIIRKSYDDKLILHTTISNFDPSSDENTLTTEDIITVSDSTISPDYIISANTTETDDEIIWLSTKKIYDESNESISYESVETTSHSNLTTITDEEQVTTSSLTTSSVTNLTSKSEEKELEMTTLKTPDNSTSYNKLRSRNTLNKHLYVRSGASSLKFDSNVTQLTPNALSDSKTNEKGLDSVNKTLNESVSQTNAINSNDTKSNTSDVRSIYLVNNNKKNITDIKVNDSHTSLRASSALKESQIEQIEKYNFKSDVKEYEVFEVAADKPPFEMKPNMDTKDTPYYIPVYNYAPDYAYYRPRSRFGRNDDSNEENKKKNYNKSKEKVKEVIKKLQLDLPIIRSIFSGYNQKEKNSYGNKPGRYIMKKPNIFDLPRPIKSNNFQEIYYNPNDYLDLDYYYGGTNMKQLRNGKGEDVSEIKFPDTDDDDHPYNTIHSSDSIKTHIRAVRKILYLNQIFEPFSEKEIKEPRKFYDKRLESQNADTKYNELRNNDADNIASDYYFGVIPYPKAVQAVAIIKTNENKLLRNPAIRKRIKTDAKYNQLNNTNNTTVKNKFNTKLDKVIEPVLDVLRDFIRFNNQALLKYNWLESTIHILAAVKKMFELTTLVQFEEPIHPKDLELLKYIIYLYKSSVNKLKRESPEVFNNEEKIQLKSGPLPKNRWSNKIRQPLKLWRDAAYYVRSKYEKERMKLLYDFEDFLQKVLFSLHDFHDAIKHIAIITKYNNQKWYDDLKHIYLHSDSDEKLLTLLLHLSVTKLLNSIEKSAIDGAENNFKAYIRNSKEYVKRSKEEFLFVLNILHELRRIKK